VNRPLRGEPNREPKCYAPCRGGVDYAPPRSRRGRDLLRRGEEPLRRCGLAGLRAGWEADPAQGHRPDQAGSQGQAQGTARRVRPRPAHFLHLHCPPGGERLAPRRAAWPVGTYAVHLPGGLDAAPGAHRRQAAQGTDGRGCPRRAGGARRDLSTRYLQIARASLARAIRYAEAHDLVDQNVATLVDAPEGQAGRPSRSLTLDQFRALLQEARESRLNAYVVLSLTVGIRTEEARELRWDHVDLDGDPGAARPAPPSVAVWRSVRLGGDTKTAKSRRNPSGR
jgi:hypothetical protein